MTKSYPSNQVRFVIRADAYAKSGAGHVMRCSVIAEELISRGFEVVFIGETYEIPWLNEYLDGLGFSQVFSAPGKFTSNPNSDVLILDSYDIDPSMPFIQSVNWSKVVVLVDDQTPAFTGDLYVHAGSGTSWKPPISSREADFLSGIEYFLIRKSLRNLPMERKLKKNSKLQILISGGGSDPFRFSEEMYKILRTSQTDFDAKILGPEFIIEDFDTRFRFLRMGREYESELLETDLVFTTAGTSSWEFLYLGLTSGIACAIPNQTANYKFQVDASYGAGIGERDSLGVWRIDPKIIHNLLLANNSKKALVTPKETFVIGQRFLNLVNHIIQPPSRVF